MEYSSVHRRFAPGDGIKFIRSIDAICRGTLVVIYCRASSRSQRRNLPNQLARLRAAVEQRGGIVVAVYIHEGTAKAHEATRLSRDIRKLALAAAEAEACGGVVLAESTDRYIRPPGFDPKTWPDAQARESELVDLRLITGGVPLVTLEHPNAPPPVVKSGQSKRGQGKDRKGGRPPRKKNIRARLKPVAVEMKEQGKSLGQITKELRLPKSTVQGWLRGVRIWSGMDGKNCPQSPAKPQRTDPWPGGQNR